MSGWCGILKEDVMLPTAGRGRHSRKPQVAAKDT